ncbi:hypothetical protein B0J18DRAFT_234939 [Chaetomium sp. MPI-SDFR-AT-0129]|nr:hypothetical protein B0J18DRAFT_234939 [Chaetomium sp. MPI-SDFR-AT-0129]
MGQSCLGIETSLLPRSFIPFPFQLRPSNSRLSCSLVSFLGVLVLCRPFLFSFCQNLFGSRPSLLADCPLSLFFPTSSRRLHWLGGVSRPHSFTREYEDVWKLAWPGCILICLRPPRLQLSFAIPRIPVHLFLSPTLFLPGCSRLFWTEHSHPNLALRTSPLTNT